MTIKDQLHLALWELEPLVSQINFRRQHNYGQWLAQQYYIARRSLPLFALSCGRSLTQGEFHRHCIRYLSKEKHHESLLVDKMNALGYSPDDFPELLSTRSLYQCQYYWIEHEHPTAFLGYLLFLEGIAITFEENSSPKSGRFWGHQQGLDECIEIIESLPESQREKILTNLHQSSVIYKSLLLELLSQNSRASISSEI